MPVHFKVASHEAKPVERSTASSLTKPEELLHNTWGVKARTMRCAELLQSSVINVSDLSAVLDRANGFVDTVILAYNAHHHLTLRFVTLACAGSRFFIDLIRPDNVWIAILGQFNF